MNTYFGKNVFDLGLKKNITADDICQYASKFIADTVNPETKDMFKIDDVIQEGQNTTFVANIEQRTVHPNSDGGFHLSAITAADIIHLLLSEKQPKILDTFDLENFSMTCKKTVRSLSPTFYLHTDPEPNENLCIDFNVEDKCYFGSFYFRKKTSDISIRTACIEDPLKNSFLIREAQIDCKTINAIVDFECFTRDKTGLGLGIGLILAISSQITIIQLYTLSNATSKKNGVVMACCDIQKKDDKKSPGVLSIQSTVEHIRPSRTLTNHVIVDVIVQCLDGSFEAKITYVFEPL
jgi:hypothetical protein